MTLRVVRLGSKRLPGEGIRIGTVRRPPRGIVKSEYAARNYYDVWLPALAPSAGLLKLALSAHSTQDWERFVGKYRREMAATSERTTIDTLAALSHTADFSVGCYCTEESRCHRAILRALLGERGANLQ